MITLVISIINHLQRSSGLLRFFGVRTARVEAYQKRFDFTTPASTSSTTWFHAASVGELEMLRALIDDFHEQRIAFGVTCFSDSALKALLDLKQKAVFAELSPAEMEWEPMFRHFNVNKLVISKYDLWPGMALAAAKLDIPVIVVNARVGKSLRFLKRLFLISNQILPRLFFFVLRKEDQDGLNSVFKNSRIDLSVDPRFERVARRIDSAQNRQNLIQPWITELSHLQKPFGVIGSAWLQDLKQLIPALKSSSDSILVVPHDLSSENTSALRKYLMKEIPGRFILVDQMGVLVELYALADWIWVGGGFGSGIHSTLEPSFYSRPIACGPARVEDFPETEELIRMGMLTVCQNTKDFEKWHQMLLAKKMDSNFLQEKKRGYRALLEDCIRIR